MKKNLVLILIVVLIFAMVIPAAAKGPGPGGNGPYNPGVGGQGTGTAYSQALPGPRLTFAMVGTIEFIDEVNMALTINVINGNKLVRDSGFTQVTVVVVETTRLLSQTSRIGTPITFADLEVGQQVSLNGIVASETVGEGESEPVEFETWTAYRITVGAYLTQTRKR